MSTRDLLREQPLKDWLRDELQKLRRPTQWEYETLANLTVKGRNAAGAEGWEAYAEVGGVTYFKRPKPKD